MSGLKLVPEAPEGCILCVVHTDSESAHESKPRGRPRSRNRQLECYNPQTANPQSVQSLAL
eukprot:9971956-Alexandrium_andersonii.AAC.1